MDAGRTDSNDQVAGSALQVSSHGSGRPNLSQSMVLGQLTIALCLSVPE